MRLRFGTTTTQPIAVDIGWSSVKLLQLEGAGVRAAYEFDMPEDVGEDADARLDALRGGLTEAIDSGRFDGRRAMVAMPRWCTLVQSMQIEGGELGDLDLAMQMRLPDTCDEWMVRAIDIGGASAAGEIICQAMPRFQVLQHVEMLHGLGIDILGVVAQPRPMVAAFNGMNRRSSDADVCTMYVDIGAGETTCVVAKGRNIVLARGISTGGRHLDAHLARSHGCTAAQARRQRLSWSPGTTVPSPARMQATCPASSRNGGTLVLDRRGDSRSDLVGPALTPSESTDPARLLHAPIEQLIDDLRLCLRHHHATHPDVEVVRVVFTGGEARQDWLCRTIVQALQLPGQIGDPLAPLECHGLSAQLQDWSHTPRPHWSVALGLSELARGETTHGA